MRPAVAWRLAVFLSLSSFLPPLSSGDSTYATVCSKTGKYKPNSTYDSNVQYVTNFLTNYASFTSGTGFATWPMVTPPTRSTGWAYAAATS
jgi:hypothetical protein